MLPNFLIEETTVRESGEGAVFDASELSDQSLLLTFGITHAVEQESIGVEIHGSKDGQNWTSKPIVTIGPKFYCGTYQMVLPLSDARYLKPVWRVARWSRGDKRPFFRFYVVAQSQRVRTAGAG
jgi:hypothetical protein